MRHSHNKKPYKRLHTYEEKKAYYQKRCDEMNAFVDRQRVDKTLTAKDMPCSVGQWNYAEDWTRASIELDRTGGKYMLGYEEITPWTVIEARAQASYSENNNKARKPDDFA